jgi:spore coat protein U-like protein
MRNRPITVEQLYAATALSLATVLATALGARAEQASIGVTGSVDDGCIVTTDFHNLTADLGKLVNAAGRLAQTSIVVSLGQVSCNVGAAKISIQSEGKGLKRQATSPSPMPVGYTDFVPYSASAVWGTLHVEFLANGGSTAQSSAETTAAMAGALNLTVGTTADQAIQPLEGTYTDTVIVKVGFLI